MVNIYSLQFFTILVLLCMASKIFQVSLTVSHIDTHLYPLDDTTKKAKCTSLLYQLHLANSSILQVKTFIGVTT